MNHSLNASNEVTDVRPLGDKINEHKTGALFASKQLKVLRLVLPAGKSIPEHKAPGEITVHCLEGRVKFTASGKTQELTAGELLFLAAELPHSVEAVESSSVLVTIALPQTL